MTNNQLIHGSGTIFELPLTNKKTIAADSSGNTLTLTGSATTNTSLMEATGGGILQIQNDETVQNTGGKIEALNGSVVNLSGIVKGGTLTTSGTGVIDSQNGTLDGTVNSPTNAGTLDVNNTVPLWSAASATIPVERLFIADRPIHSSRFSPVSTRAASTWRRSQWRKYGAASLRAESGCRAGV